MASGMLIGNCDDNGSRGMVLNGTKYKTEWLGWDEIKDECWYCVLLGWGWGTNKLLLVLKEVIFWYIFFLFSEKYLRINNKSNKK